MLGFWSLSGSVFDCFSVPGLIVLHLEEKSKTKKPLADFKSAKQVLPVFLVLQAEGDWALSFFFPPFPVVLHWGLSLGSNIYRCPTSSLSPQSVVWPPLSLYARPMPLTHLIVPPFDESMWCTEWEQLAPHLLPLCGPGRCMWAKSLRGSLVPLLN